MVRVMLKLIQTSLGSAFSVCRESDRAWLQDSTRGKQVWDTGGGFIGGMRFFTKAATETDARKEIAEKFPDFLIASVDSAG